MKQTIGLSEFRSAFFHADRNNNFSYEAQELLFDYFEEVDEDMELDVIAICCDYIEADVDTIIQDYSLELDDMTDEGKEEYVREWISEETSLIGETHTGFVYAAF